MPGKILASPEPSSTATDPSLHNVSTTTTTTTTTLQTHSTTAAMSQTDPPTDPALLSPTSVMQPTDVQMNAQDHDRNGDLAGAPQTLVEDRISFMHQLQQVTTLQQPDLQQQQQQQATQSQQLLVQQQQQLQAQNQQVHTPQQPGTPSGGGQVCR
jgi:hypothetical protein